MSSHDGFDDAVAAYALGALDEADRRAFEIHLSECVTCQRELAALDRLAAGLGLAAGALAPPPALKARTLAHATAQPQHARGESWHDVMSGSAATTVPAARQPRRWVRPTWVAIAAGLVLALGLGGYIAALHSQIRSLQQAAAEAATRAEDLRAELTGLRTESLRLTRTVDVLSAPDVIRIDLRGQPAAAAAGRAFVSGTRGLLFSVENMPPLPPDRTYQVWAIPAGASPVGIGLFSVDARGASVLRLTVPAGAENLQTIAVTVEPAGGSPGPTSAIVLAGTRPS